MKKSKKVILTSLLASVALTACEQEQARNEAVKHCVDKDRKVVEETYCSEPQRHGYRSGMPWLYYWYFLNSNRAYSPGSRIAGGSFEPTPGRAYSTPSSVSRGGLGGTARGSGTVHSSGAGA